VSLTASFGNSWEHCGSISLNLNSSLFEDSTISHHIGTIENR
jgi:hypothetical protein